MFGYRLNAYFRLWVDIRSGRIPRSLDLVVLFV